MDFEALCECGHTAMEHHNGGSCWATKSPTDYESVCACDHFTKLDESGLKRESIESRRAASLAKLEAKRAQSFVNQLAGAVSLLTASGYTVISPTGVKL